MGLGHAGFCAKQLLNGEPFTVLLPDILVLDKKSLSKNYSFSAMVEAWNETGIGQVMVERVSFDTLENFGVADLVEEISEPFKSIPLEALIEKPSAEKAPSNLAALGRYILPFNFMPFLRVPLPVWVERYSSLTR